ncbi:MAG: hypothetical protein KGN34_18875 [Sphingomonadales bacterium]|nr:hypothetical protein [Sphingomonadales bacterium]
MNDADAKTAFLILSFMRLSGAAFAVFGLAIVAGRIALPAFMGLGLVILGAVESLVLPTLLARKWKSRD